MHMPVKPLLAVVAVAMAAGPSAAQTAAAQTAAAQTAAAQTAAAQTAAAPAAGSDAPAPKRLAAGTGGLFQPGLLLQGWFQDTNTSISTFRVRRAEISFKGDIVPGKASYGVMFDPAKVLEFQDKKADVSGGGTVTVKQPVGATAVLQDFWLTFPTTYVDVTLGQVKIPVSLEGFGSSSKLLFPERALVSKQFGDKRDIGVRLSKAFPFFGYTAGIVNGTEANKLDTNDEKDLTLRLEAYPVKGLVVAGVVYATVGGRNTNAKDRYEGDVRFESGPLLVQAEYIAARDVDASAAATNSQGFYGAAGWTLFDVLQPCVRVGFLDLGTDTWHFDGGLNYYLRKNEAKLQISYSRYEFETGPGKNEVIVAGQVWF